MITVKQAIIVEGKYDKIKLSGIINAPIITTEGFGIFKDTEKMALIKRIAFLRGIIILTDSDSAGFVIRSYLSGCVDPKYVTNVYIPEILGKEKRKQTASCEGILGVEGVSTDIIISAFEKAGVFCEKCSGENNPITMVDLYELGLCGTSDSSFKRKELLKTLDLPIKMSTKAMLVALNAIYTKPEFLEFFKG